jgi:hypothetical protein
MPTTLNTVYKQYEQCRLTSSYLLKTKIISETPLSSLIFPRINIIIQQLTDGEVNNSHNAFKLFTPIMSHPQAAEI